MRYTNEEFFLRVRLEAWQPHFAINVRPYPGYGETNTL